MLTFRNRIVLLAAAALMFQGTVGAEETELARFDAAIQAGQYASVRPELEKYTASHPESWRAWYQLGYVDFRLQQIQPSLNFLCKSLVLQPNFAESHKILAYDLNILGRQDLALQELDIAIRQDPSSAESYYESGRIYYERGSYLQAVRQLEKARDLKPDFVRVYHNLGLAYSALRENEKAVASFEEGIRRNELQTHRSAWPLIDYATFLNMHERFSEARDLLLRSIAFEDKYDTAYDELSKAYRGLGHTAEAITALRHAATLNPGRADYHYVLARLLAQAHQADEAKLELSLYEQKRVHQ